MPLLYRGLAVLATLCLAALPCFTVEAASTVEDTDGGDRFIASVLGRLGLLKYLAVFEREEVTDRYAFSELTEDDLVALGLPLGARAKLRGELRRWPQNVDEELEEKLVERVTDLVVDMASSQQEQVHRRRANEGGNSGTAAALPQLWLKGESGAIAFGPARTTTLSLLATSGDSVIATSGAFKLGQAASNMGPCDGTLAGALQWDQMNSALRVCDGVVWSELAIKEEKSAPPMTSVAPAAAAGGGGLALLGVTTVTQSGTYTNELGATAVHVTLVGAGGHGRASKAAGGGAGGTAFCWVSDPGDEEAVTIAAPVADLATAGGASAFGEHCSASGGGPGQTGAVADGGHMSATTGDANAGGVGEGGYLGVKGGYGCWGKGVTEGASGGASFFGGSGALGAGAHGFPDGAGTGAGVAIIRAYGPAGGGEGGNGGGGGGTPSGGVGIRSGYFEKYCKGSHSYEVAGLGFRPQAVVFFSGVHDSTARSWGMDDGENPEVPVDDLHY